MPLFLLMMNPEVQLIAEILLQLGRNDSTLTSIRLAGKRADTSPCVAERVRFCRKAA
jgi:hypothetical protein